MLDMLKVTNKDVVLVFLLLTLNTADFEHIIYPLGSRACSKIPVSKNLYHIKTSPGFYMIGVFTERYFRIDCNRFSSNF